MKKPKFIVNNDNLQLIYSGNSGLSGLIEIDFLSIINALTTDYPAWIAKNLDKVKPTLTLINPKKTTYTLYLNHAIHGYNKEGQYKYSAFKEHCIESTTEYLSTKISKKTTITLPSQKLKEMIDTYFTWLEESYRELAPVIDKKKLEKTFWQEF